MTDEKKYAYLGFAQKAGKLVSGDNSVEAKIKAKGGRCLVIAADASEATKEKFCRLAGHCQVPFIVFGEKERFGDAVGKSPRSVLLILDQNIAGQILR